MAGYREFQTGEVLTAANVNQFLMEQATMTFADAAARDAALAGVLREGLLTYNLDEGRLEVYDGTAWVEPAPAGEVVQRKRLFDDTNFITGDTTFVDVTGVQIEFTPQFDDSIIRVYYITMRSGTDRGSNSIADRRGEWRVVKDAETTEFADMSCSTGINHTGATSTSLFFSNPMIMVGEEVSGSTASRTYKLQARVIGQVGTRVFCRPHYWEVIEYRAGVL